MATAARRAPPGRKRRPRDPSAHLPRRALKRKTADKMSTAEEEKRKKKRKEEKKKRQKEKKVEDEKGREEETKEKIEEEGGGVDRVGISASPSFLLSTASASQQLRYFLHQFESANKFRISSLELEPVKDTCFVKLHQDINQDVDNFCKHMKDTFGVLWKEILYDKKLLEGKVDAGSPVVLIISTSALRSLELLRGLRPLTRECRPAKLFAKHIKVDDQISLLKNRVNIASGTPSRIKKLIDMEALSLSRLAVIVLDMHKDAKGFSLFTLPQVRNEFWDLYKSYFHQRLIQGDLRICFYGPTSVLEFEKTQARDESQISLSEEK